MSVPSTTGRNEFNFNGSLTSFTFDFPIIETSDLLVIVRLIATGTETTLTEGTDYEVTSALGDFSSGGIVFMIEYIDEVKTPKAWPATYKLILLRDVPATQGVDFTENMATLYENFERGLDKLTMLVQQLLEAQDRTLTVPRSEASTLSRELPSAPARALKMLGFDSDGQPVAVTEIDGVSVTTFGNAILTADDAEAGREALELDNVENVEQIPLSYLDTDTSLAADSDTKVPSQKATKSYVDTAVAAVSANAVTARQTVLSSLISSGLPAFITDPDDGLKVGIDTDDGDAPLVLSFAAGFGPSGPVEYIGVVDSDTSIASLTDTTTCYLYAERNAGTGVISFGHVTVAPLYQHSAPSHAANQYWFSLADMKMYLSNGSDTWTEKQVVFLGEAVTSGGQVTSVVNYALRGEYVGDWTANPGTNVAISKNHNIGTNLIDAAVEVKKITTAEHGYSIGDIAGAVITQSSSYWYTISLRKLRNSVGFYIANTVYIGAQRYDSGLSVDSLNWEYRIKARRSF